MLIRRMIILYSDILNTADTIIIQVLKGVFEISHSKVLDTPKKYMDSSTLVSILNNQHNVVVVDTDSKILVCNFQLT